MKHTLGILASSIVISILGGVLGAVIAGTLLLSEANISQQPGVVQQPIIVSYDSAAQHIPDVRGSLVKLIIEHGDGIRIQYGVVLSSDGWIAFHGKIPVSNEQIRIVDNRNSISRVSEIAQDPAFEIWYAKSDSTALKAVDFLDKSRLTDNLSGVLVYGFQTVQPLLITGLGYSDDKYLTGIKTYEIRKKHNYEQQFTGKQQGLAVFSGDGKFIGFTEARGIVPGAFIRTVLPALFSKAVARRPSLGVAYEDASWVPTISGQTADTKRGARIIGKKALSYQLTTIEGNVIHVREGDIIRAVNQEQLDINRSLSDVIQQYQPGAAVTITVDQSGDTYDYTFVLSAKE
ncbi:hypothetical protein HYV71_00455 [Candidatus Uhrbacteria bacterium]|nr:hypothetical protein [Candidatus Uhrbacteria bacterium]